MTIEHVVNLEQHRNAPRIHFQLGQGIFERLFGKFRVRLQANQHRLQCRVEESRAVGKFSVTRASTPNRRHRRSSRLTEATTSDLSSP